MINNNNQKVYEKNAKLSEGKGIVELYKSYNLSRGQYNLIIQSKNNKSIIKKLVDTKKWSTGYLNPLGLKYHQV